MPSAPPVDCLLLSFDRLPIDLGGQTAEAAAVEGKWVYLFVTKAKAKAATFAAAAAAANSRDHGHN